MLAGAALLAWSGCALLDAGFSNYAPGAGDLAASGGRWKQLKPITPSRNALKLDIVLVERPLSDELLGPALWREVDQVGAVDSFEMRESLQENGFRVGRVASNPPHALESLLSWTERSSEFVDSQDPDHIICRSLYLQSGAQTKIRTSRTVPQCRVLVPGHLGRSQKDYENAHFVFTMKAHRIQDGWAEVEILPEIHYGEWQLRPKATRLDWQAHVGQRIEPVYSQRFKVKLLLGEMALVTVEGNDPQSLGRHFFVVGNEDEPTYQRLLVVRLADMNKVQGTRAR